MCCCSCFCHAQYAALLCYTQDNLALPGVKQNDATMLGEKIEVQRLQLTRAKAAYEQLEKGRIQREYNAKYVREDVEKQVNARFNNFLKRRRHAGVIKINYKDHELEMEVHWQRHPN